MALNNLNHRVTQSTHPILYIGDGHRPTPRTGGGRRSSSGGLRVLGAWLGRREGNPETAVYGRMESRDSWDVFVGSRCSSSSEPALWGWKHPAGTDWRTGSLQSEYVLKSLQPSKPQNIHAEPWATTILCAVVVLLIRARGPFFEHLTHELGGLLGRVHHPWF